MFGGVGVGVGVEEVMFAVVAIAQLISCGQGPPQPLSTSIALHNINAISYLAGARRYGIIRKSPEDNGIFPMPEISWLHLLARQIPTSTIRSRETTGIAKLEGEVGSKPGGSEKPPARGEGANSHGLFSLSRLLGISSLPQ